MRVLIVEDDPDLGALLVLGLRNRGYAVDLAVSFHEATAQIGVTDYDVACIDLGLPDGDGLDLIHLLLLEGTQRTERPRIIVTTARDGVAQRVAGLDAGADDYLVKPFDFDELVARIRAVSRRQHQTGTTLTVGDICLDLAALRVERSGREISLTTREFALLRYLMQRPGEVLSAEHLLEHVWDANADPMSTTVRVILSRVRKKLGSPNPITTLEGAGYRIEVAT